MIRKLLQVYLLWRMVRESKLRAKKRWKRRYFRASEFIFQLSDSERLILENKYGVDWMMPTMDLGFSIGERIERTDFFNAEVSEYSIGRDEFNFCFPLLYFKHMREVNQYHRKIFWRLLKQIL